MREFIAEPLLGRDLRIVKGVVRACEGGLKMGLRWVLKADREGRLQKSIVVASVIAKRTKVRSRSWEA